MTEKALSLIEILKNAQDNARERANRVGAIEGVFGLARELIASGQEVKTSFNYVGLIDNIEAEAALSYPNSYWEIKAVTDKESHEARVFMTHPGLGTDVDVASDPGYLEMFDGINQPEDLNVRMQVMLRYAFNRVMQFAQNAPAAA